jgi:acyl-CoA dehydrogenase
MPVNCQPIGTVESGISTTEPHNPGSDLRSLDTSPVLDGNHWVINGHKWFTFNGIDAAGESWDFDN